MWGDLGLQMWGYLGLQMWRLQSRINFSISAGLQQGSRSWQELTSKLDFSCVRKKQKRVRLPWSPSEQRKGMSPLLGDWGLSWLLEEVFYYINQLQHGLGHVSCLLDRIPDNQLQNYKLVQNLWWEGSRHHSIEFLSSRVQYTTWKMYFQIAFIFRIGLKYLIISLKLFILAVKLTSSHHPSQKRRQRPYIKQKLLK